MGAGKQARITYRDTNIIVVSPLGTQLRKLHDLEDQVLEYIAPFEVLISALLPQPIAEEVLEHFA